MRHLLLALAIALAACADGAPATLLDGPRIVAVIADPPTIAVDRTAALTLVTALDGAPATPELVRWRACSPAALVVDPIRDCAGDAAVPLPVDADGRARVDVAALATRFGIALPAEADDPCGRAVAPLTIVVEAELGGARMIASKQLSVGASPPERTNPQFLRVLGDGAEVTAPITFAPGTTVELSVDLAHDALDAVCEPHDAIPTRRESVRVSVYPGGGAVASDLAFDVIEVAGATIAGSVALTMPDGPARVPIWLVAVDEGGGVAVLDTAFEVR